MTCSVSLCLTPKLVLQHVWQVLFKETGDRHSFSYSHWRPLFILTIHGSFIISPEMWNQLAIASKKCKYRCSADLSDLPIETSYLWILPMRSTVTVRVGVRVKGKGVKLSIQIYRNVLPLYFTKVGQCDNVRLSRCATCSVRNAVEGHLDKLG